MSGRSGFQPGARSRELSDELDRVARAAAAELGVPGFVLGVILGNEIHTLCHGITNVEHPLPVTDRTLFQIGSTTKTVTATALMRLVERGALDLDQPVRSVLPEFSLAVADAARRVTVRHLLTHVAGWDGDWFLVHRLGPDARLAQVIERMPEVPQLTPPGATYAYNNCAFAVAGRVLEVLHGSRYEQAVDELVLAPLGMTRVRFRAEEMITDRVAAGHHVVAGVARVARPWGLGPAAAAHGGIVADLEDMLTYARFHLGDGTTRDGAPLLQPETMQLMRREHVEAGSNCAAFGLSWQLHDTGGLRTVRHGGETNGQLAAFVLQPERGFALVTMTNADTGAVLNRRLVAWCLEHLLDAREVPRPTLPPEPEHAGEYLGTLRNATVSVADEEMSLVVQPNARSDRPAPPPQRVRLVRYAADRVIDADQPFGDRCGEFLRDARGEIAWLRWDGRLLRRVATTL